MTVFIASPKFEGVVFIETPLDREAWCAEVRSNGGLLIGEQFLKPEDLRTEFHED